jgi:choline dehydrogenase-like flavoprotein
MQTRRHLLGSALGLAGAAALRRLAGVASGSDTHPGFEATPLAEARASDLEADVCIVGSGPAGAVLARALVRRDIRTLVLESGPSSRKRAGAVGLDDLDAYSASGDLDYPIATTRFRGEGGTANLWTGGCPRFHPIDFEPNAYTPPGAPWPLGYDDLEPFYLAAEKELRVHGMENMPHAPRRSAPFPHALKKDTPNIARLLGRTGVDFDLTYRPTSGGAGPPLRMTDRHLPEFAASPHGTLICDATATSIETSPGGRITGIRVQSLGGEPRTARARFYVVAGGAVETARLLLLSRSTRFPDGIGNHSDLVGRFFMEHPSVVFARGAVKGLWHPTSVSERAYTERFVLAAKRAGLGGVRLRLRADHARVGFDWGHPLESAGRSLHGLRNLGLEIKALIEMEPSPRNRVTLNGRQRDAFGNPGADLALHPTENDRRTIAHAEAIVMPLLADLGAERVRARTGWLRWDHHHMGTCRMGDDPATSVVDRHLCVHDTGNLYVTGSAPFVTSSVSNPTLTITALTLRLADHLIARLRP